VVPTEDSGAFFRHLPALLPVGSTLYFEATSLVPDIREFFERHPASQTCQVHAGACWPWRERFHVAFSPEIARELSEVVKGFADTEICDHLLAYRDGKVLLEWFDAWFRPLYLSRQIPE
jgi:hypothetical protein